jgi:hypothetical protein
MTIHSLASEQAGDVETSGLSEGLYIKNRGLCEEWIGVVVLEVVVRKMCIVEEKEN